MARRIVLLVALLLGGVSMVVGASVEPRPGELTEDVVCSSDPELSYTLYLPPGYTPERRWPALLVLDPRGRSVLAAELFREAAREYGWLVLSSNDSRSDTREDVNLPALNALWHEVHTRWAVDEERIYGAGFSGTAYILHLAAKETGRIAGVIASGARFFPDLMKGSQVAWFGAVGDEDFNYREMRAIEELLSEQGNLVRLEVFEGPHRWMPEPLARLAVGWMELAAMRSGRRPVDEALVDRLYAEEMAAAADLEASDRGLEAMRRFQAVARLFEGLRDVGEAAEAAARLAGSGAVERALEEEKRWNAFEARYERTLERAMVAVGGDSRVPPLEEVTRELMIGDLEKRARRGGWEGATAGRILNRLGSVFGFYMAQDMLAKGRYEEAAVALGVAVAIDDRDPVARYNLACALARAGRPAAALDSLERAVELGFRNLEHIESDPDLESLHDEERYQTLVASLETP